MTALITCLKRNASLHSDDKAAIKASAKEYREAEGLSITEASDAAVNDAIEEAKAERAEAVSYIQKRGGVAPSPPKDPGAATVAKPAPPAAPVAPAAEKQQSGHEKLARAIDQQLVNGNKMTWNQLFGMADDAFGGTQADGIYTPKDAYDGLEAGINLFIMNEAVRFKLNDVPHNIILRIDGIYNLIPTQTKRTQEQQELQQFSTPHQHAYVMNWVADIQPGDIMLEPSAGTGNIAVHSQLAGAEVHVNEISDRRADLLQAVMPDATVTRENAAHLNSILPGVNPTVVVMNPPFSADLNKPGKMDTSIGAGHVEEMLNMLQPGGRLVALVGRGMAMDRPRFKPWWNRIGKEYDVRANIGISGKAYRKLGTSFDNQLLVIDKLPPSGRATVTGNYAYPEDLIVPLEEVKNERPRTTEAKPTPDREAIEGGAERPGREVPGRPSVQPAADAGVDTAKAGRDEESVSTGVEIDAGTAAETATGRGTEIPAGKRGGRGSNVGEAVTEPEGGVTPGTGAVSTVEPAPKDDSGAGRLPSDKSQSDTAETGVRVKKTKKEKKTRKSLEESGAIFEKYKPALKVKGSKPHPTKLSESVPMASVSIPDVTYSPKVDKELIESGKLSDSQMEVIALAGQAHEQMLPDGNARRGFFVGNGCVAAGTRIFNPITGMHTPIEDLSENNKTHVVLSLTSHGMIPRIASAPFLKGRAELFIVTLESGKKVTVTNEHKFLTHAGWKTLSDGIKPDHIIACVQSDRLSDTEVYPYAHSGNDLDCLHTPADCLDDCSTYLPWSGCEYGEQPHAAQDTYQEPFPSQGDAHEHSHEHQRADVHELLQGHSHQNQLCDRHSKNSFSPLESHVRALTLSQDSAYEPQSLTEKRQAFQQSHELKAVQNQPVCEAAFHQDSFSFDLFRSSTEDERRASLDDKQSSVESRQTDQIYQSNDGQTHTEKQSQRFDQKLISSLYGSKWNRIASIESMGDGEYYDMYVPGPENYVAEGIIHHNTGVGKGAEIAGIILDNWNNGRKKAVWISENAKLANDAKRDLEWVGFDSKKTLLKQSSIKGAIGAKEGVVFTTYDTLRSSSKIVKDASGNVVTPELKRIDQMANWLGPNFDGVIAFDEAHNMGNALDTKGARGIKTASQRATAGLELQKKLPKARIIYVSATGATEVTNLAYADRLGLWGEGTAFADKQTFISQIDSGGVAAMEVVARDMKSMGMYESRSLSYDGVTYETLEHKLTKDQNSIYDDLAEAWQIVLKNIDTAMESSGSNNNAMARKNARGAFWGTHQRFFNQVITGMQIPTLIKDVEKQLKAGNSILMQLVNTNEATQERRLAQAADEDIALEDVDLSPRDILMQYLQRSFPTVKYEEYTDDNGNTKTRAVRDANDNVVEDAKAVAIRDGLMERLATIRVPQGAIDQVVDYFGPDKVAEITGRKRRIITRKDGSKEEEKLGAAKSNKDADAFMAGKKRILIFSDAGGTGRSYHSSLNAKNQQRRIHYLVQPGWRADKVMQGFGRSHRTNQHSAPHYALVTTNIVAQKRFLSSVARRLDQLGALTKGSREASNQGMFDASLNLENQYAEDAVHILFQDLSAGKIEGITIQEVETQMALGILDQETGQKKMKSLGVKDLLNRLMSMKRNDMDIVFNAFFERLQANVEYAKQQGTLDVGMETITADNIKKVEETRVYEGKGGASNSHYVKLELTDPTKITAFGLVAQGKARFGRNRRSGKLYALTPSTSVTDQKTGDIVDRVRRESTSGHDYIKASEVREKYDEVKGTREELRAAWAEEIEKTPKTHTRTVHMITGSLLPIWDRLPGQSSRVYRTVTDEGEALLGRSIAPTMVKETLKALGIQSKVPKLTAQGFVDEVMKKGSVLLLSNGNKIKRSRVSGEDRLEITGASLAEVDLLKNMGAFTEIIAYKNRVFIPADKAGQIVGRITASKPVVEVIEKGEGGGMPSGVGAKQGGALDVSAFIPRRRTPVAASYDIINGYHPSGQPIIEKTVHPSVRDRKELDKFWRRNFIKEGMLPDEGFMRKIQMEGVMSEVGVHENFFGHVFKRTVKKYLGRSYTSLSGQERDAINDALAGDDAAMSRFHPEVANVIRAMRAHLDDISANLMRTLDELIAVRLEALDDKTRDRTIAAIDDIAAGVKEDEIKLGGTDPNIVRKAWLKMTIQGNLGQYMNRAYQAFEDPKWGKKIRKNAAVMADARDYLRDRVRSQEEARLTKEARKRVEAASPWQEMIKGPGTLESKSAAREQLVQAELATLYDKEGLSPREIDSIVKGHINNILDAAEVSQDMIGWLSNGEKLGQKDLSILKHRKNIAEPIRALLGEHKDPVYNYMRSASKMTFLVASHDFLMNIRKDGLGAFLSLDKIDRFGTEIMANDPETMTPLTGLYATKEFAQALEDAIGHAERNMLIKQWLRANAIVKYGATVLSPITTARNFLSAAWFTAFNGHFSWAYGGLAAGATFADLKTVAGRGEITDAARWQSYIGNLIEKGVLHSGVRSEELLDAANDAINMDRQYGKVVEGIKTVVVKYPTALYRAGDDFWKIIGFENEVKSLMRWRKLPRSEAEVIAADRIRNGYPTYSHVPAGIKAIRKFPVLGPFVSFPWEIMRTTGHQFRFIKEDLAEGNLIPAARRIVGMSISTALPIAGVAIGMATSGVDKEEDEAYRFVGPTWQRNSDLIYFRTASGQLWAYDVSHMNAYAYLKKPIAALLNGNNEGAMEKLYDATKEVLSPYIGVEITTGAFIEWWRNKKFGTGHEVYNEQDDLVGQARSVISHLRRRLQPGAARQLENLYLASQDHVSRGGKEYKMIGEIATFFGFRFTPINERIALKYRAREYSYATGDANRLLSYPMSDINQLDEGDADDPIAAVIKAHKRISKDMIKAIKATRAMGISPPQLIEIMKAASISKKDMSFLLAGKVPPWMPTKQFLSGTMRMAIATAKPEDRAKVARQYQKRRAEVMRAAIKSRREALAE